jgi:benzodiazapine receptor
MSRGNTLGLIGWVALSNAAGLIGALATSRAGDFYRTLERPEWGPPSWLFGPVWTLLYVLMGVAAWLVWKAPDAQEARHRRQALALFVAQLVVNALWSWIFFAWREGALAFVEIIVLALMIVATIAAFHRISRRAAWLLIPYLAWVLFATVLTYSIWRRNPGVL